MRHLLILRHAKAVPHRSGDIDRELTNRGRREAGLMGRQILARGLLPDLALVSPSTRTRETIALAMAQWPAPAPLQIDRAIYLAEAPALLDVLRAAPDAPQTLMIVGHNPGLAELALNLTGGGDPQARMRMMEGFPTGALAVMEVPADHWGELSFHGARLKAFITPRGLEA